MTEERAPYNCLEMRRDVGTITAAVSGGFDPLHAGHVELLQDARRFCGCLIVILNTDRWLEEKKGAAFLPLDHRFAIIEALACVDKVVVARDGDGTVCESLRDLRPDYFINSGDRTKENTPELAVCNELGIHPVWLKPLRHPDAHSSKFLQTYAEALRDQK